MECVRRRMWTEHVLMGMCGWECVDGNVWGRAPSPVQPSAARRVTGPCRVITDSLWRQPPFDSAQGKLSAVRRAQRGAIKKCHTLPMSRPWPAAARDLTELLLGYGLILFILWIPETRQRILSPVALIVTLAIVLASRPTAEDLGLIRRGLAASFWILPAAIVLAIASMLVAKRIGTLHPLYKADVKHIAGYILWTLYQQILLNDLFMPRLTRLLASESAAIGLAAVLFATAHLPNLPLTVATLVWGAISCALFRRYRNLYALGLAQGLLGLCFAICVPDALHHHLRVGLGYLRYRGAQPVP
jgi:hypothetical protein